MTNATGNFLIAFVAIFINVVGSQLWTIICYVIHRLLSAPKRHLDTFHYQRQALLRSGSSPFPFAFKLGKLIWIWCRSRSKKRDPLPNVAFALVAVVYGCAFIVSGVFSARVTSADSPVLIRPNKCGWFEVAGETGNLNSTDSQMKVLTALYSSGTQLFQQSNTYARNCYTSIGSSSCKATFRTNIPSLKTDSISCPFDDPTVCETSAISFDTGYLDSNVHLGINSARKDRVRFRKILTCAVIRAEERFSSDHLDDSEGSQNSPNRSGVLTNLSDSSRYYFLGPLILANGTVAQPYTFKISTLPPEVAYLTE